MATTSRSASRSRMSPAAGSMLLATGSSRRTMVRVSVSRLYRTLIGDVVERPTLGATGGGSVNGLPCSLAFSSRVRHSFHARSTCRRRSRRSKASSSHSANTIRNAPDWDCARSQQQAGHEVCVGGGSVNGSPRASASRRRWFHASQSLSASARPSARPSARRCSRIRSRPSSNLLASTTMLLPISVSASAAAAAVMVRGAVSDHTPRVASRSDPLSLKARRAKSAMPVKNRPTKMTK